MIVHIFRILEIYFPFSNQNSFQSNIQSHNNFPTRVQLEKSIQNTSILEYPIFEIQKIRIPNNNNNNPFEST